MLCKLTANCHKWVHDPQASTHHHDGVSTKINKLDCYMSLCLHVSNPARYIHVSCGIPNCYLTVDLWCIFWPFPQLRHVKWLPRKKANQLSLSLDQKLDRHIMLPSCSTVSDYDFWVKTARKWHWEQSAIINAGYDVRLQQTKSFW